MPSLDPGLCHCESDEESFDECRDESLDNHERPNGGFPVQRRLPVQPCTPLTGDLPVRLCMFVSASASSRSD